MTNKDEKKDSKLFIGMSISVILIIIILVFGITYTSSIIGSGTEDNKKAKVSTATLAVQYIDGSSTITFDEKMGPGDTITKEFSVQNKGTGVGYYTIVLKDITNNFSRKQDIKYTLARKNNTSTTTVISGSTTGTQFPSTGSSTIAQNEQVAVGATNTYILTVTYVNEQNTDQSTDMGKTLSAKIDITESAQEPTSHR